MSRERIERTASFRQCKSKARYRDHAEAVRVRKGRQASGAGYLRIYECPLCNGMHLTSTRLKGDVIAAE